MNNITDILKENLSCDDFIALFSGQYPLLKEYSSTPQDPLWHAEGDVKIHTNMVLDEGYKAIRGPASHLSEKDKVIYILACLFHDYAKPITTSNKEIKEQLRTVAPRHEGIGASLLFNMDPPLNLSAQDWLSVVQLTAYHHIPKRLVLHNKPKPDYARLARQVCSLELLYWLEYADMQGRLCADKEEQIDIINLFKIEAMEHGLWRSDGYDTLLPMIEERFPEKEKTFHNRVAEQAKIHFEEQRIYMLEEELSIAYNYMSQPHLIITCGMAGSGKSTWLNQNVGDYMRIELDAIRDRVSKGRANQTNDDEVVRIAHEALKQGLREKKNVVWDATNYRSDFRKRIIDAGVAYGAFTEIVAFNKPLSRLLKDNKEREHAVPQHAFDSMLRKFQWPEVGEAHSLKIIFQ